jgi:hypothetical protein
MPQDNKKNIFGHPSVAKPVVDNRRLAQMAEMLQENPEDELEQPQIEQKIIADLEQLIFLGCIQDSKTINGYTFDMRTLTGKEQNDVWMSVAFLNADTKVLVIKTSFLARSITAVNGKNTDMLYRGSDFRELNKEQRAMKVIETWQDTLINELYDFYAQLVQRSQEIVKVDSIKK